ncbi:MAG: PAS domain-containing sensor histidine kinase [Methylobacter sp.]
MNKLPDKRLDPNRSDNKAQALLDMHRETIQKQAELMLHQSDHDIDNMSPDDIRKLLSKFQVHQIELKMQNEELNRVHQELTASRDSYAQLYDLSPAAYVTLNAAGIIKNANIAATDLFGSPKNKLLNKKLSEFIHESDQNDYYLFIHNLLSGKPNQEPLSAKIKKVGAWPSHLERQPWPYETRQLNYEGKFLTYVECRARTIYDDNSEQRICLTINDITERKQAQETITSLNEKLEEKIRQQTRELIESNTSLMKKVEELRHSKHQLLEREAKLNSIFNASVEGIITIDMSNIIVSANAAVETIFGYRPDEIVGCCLTELMPSPPKTMNDYDLPDTAAPIGQIQEVEGRHKNGSTVPLDLSVAEFSIDNEHFFANIVRDVSVRKHREQQDKEHLDELAHVTRLGLMGEMASGIAHEVNQPLSAISSYTQVSLNLVNTENPDLVKLTETLYKTQQQALRAGRIIHRMREFVKSHSKHRSTTNINHLIHDAVGLCIPELKQNNIKLTFDLENGLPAIYVDQIQIEQVIINLIRNSVDALKSLPSKQLRQLSIHSRLKPEQGIQIRVKDNGPGLDAVQQQKILTPFYTTKADGMGMGLSISRSLVEAHDGSLNFNSTPGKGTSFYFTLPIRRKPDER